MAKKTIKEWWQKTKNNPPVLGIKYLPFSVIANEGKRLTIIGEEIKEDGEKIQLIGKRDDTNEKISLSGNTELVAVGWKKQGKIKVPRGAHAWEI